MTNDSQLLQANWPQYTEAVEHGHFDKASRWLRQALAESQKTGAADPALIDSADELAQLYFDASNFSGAASLLRTVLEARMRMLGPDHPSVQQTRRSLAQALWQTGGLSPELLASAIKYETATSK